MSDQMLTDVETDDDVEGVTTLTDDDIMTTFRAPAVVAQNGDADGADGDGGDGDGGDGGGDGDGGDSDGTDGDASDGTDGDG